MYKVMQYDIDQKYDNKNTYYFPMPKRRKFLHYDKRYTRRCSCFIETFQFCYDTCVIPFTLQTGAAIFYSIKFVSVTYNVKINPNPEICFS